VRKLLEPVLAMPEPVHLVCREGRPEALATELALHQLDVVLSDAPVGPESKIRVFNHLLCESTVSIFAVAPLAERYAQGFPASLSGAPMLLPHSSTVLRRHLQHWFERTGLRPAVVGEFEDSALLGVFAQTGLGLFAAPDVVAAEVERQHEVRRVGPAEGVIERFYAVSVERQHAHPAVAALEAAAREQLVR
jgi:LysR family transcriptional regulator, transcriptional activator of nhaA